MDVCGAPAAVWMGEQPPTEWAPLLCAIPADRPHGVHAATRDDEHGRLQVSLWVEPAQVWPVFAEDVTVEPDASESWRRLRLQMLAEARVSFVGVTHPRAMCRITGVA